MAKDIEDVTKYILGPSLLENSLKKVNKLKNISNQSVLKSKSLEILSLLNNEDAVKVMSIYKKDRIKSRLEFQIYDKKTSNEQMSFSSVVDYLQDYGRWNVDAYRKKIRSLLFHLNNDKEQIGKVDSKNVVREKMDLHLFHSAKNKLNLINKIKNFCIQKKFTEMVLEKTSNYVEKIELKESEILDGGELLKDEVSGIRKDIEGLLRVAKYGYKNFLGEERYMDEMIVLFGKNLQLVEFIHEKSAEFSIEKQVLKDIFNNDFKAFLLKKTFNIV